MRKQSAGILVYRIRGGKAEVLLVHPGGPFWGHKDFWSIPKGELNDDEDHLAAAFREFKEEMGMEPPKADLTDLGSIGDHSFNKDNFIWAVEGDIDVADVRCNTFKMEWPPNSGKTQEFPENDRAEWFDLFTAHQKLFKGQKFFIDRLAKHLNIDLPPEPEQQSLI